MPHNSKDIDKLIGNLLGGDPSNSYSNEPLSQGQNNAVNAKLAPLRCRHHTQTLVEDDINGQDCFTVTAHIQHI